MVKIGIIGGSGLEDPRILKDAKELEVTTPYGKPSSPLTVGKIEGIDVVILSRHGKKHEIMPTNVPYQANIWAMKELNVTHIIAPTACGSLREEIKPGDLIFIDQFIDRTTKRKSTFYEGAKVCHIPMAEPFCTELRKLFIQTARKLGIQHHEKGTMVIIEGPRFGTKAESHLFRSWGCDAVNMTTIPEAVLAREAGIHYQPIAMSTDYDSWHVSEEDVTIELILKTMKENAEKVKKIILEVIPLIKDSKDQCTESIKTAMA